MSLTGSVDPRTDPDSTARTRLGSAVRSLVDTTQVIRWELPSGSREQATGSRWCPTSPRSMRLPDVCSGSTASVISGREKRRTPRNRSVRSSDFGALRFGIAICAEGDVDFPFDEPGRRRFDRLVLCRAWTARSEEPT